MLNKSDKTLTKKTEFVAFRCPTKIFTDLLMNAENRSEIMIKALKSYNPAFNPEFKENLLKGYLQFNQLFVEISEHFKNGRSMISLENFMDFVKKHITYELIDKINEVVC